MTSTRIYFKLKMKQTEEVTNSVNRLAENLAMSISSRDAGRVAALFVEDDYTKYVSDGTVIKKDKLENTLAKFYGELQSIDFRWKKKKVRVLNEKYASLTAWAVYVSNLKSGESTLTRAVYTFLCMKEEEKWSILTAHKSTQTR